MPAYLRIKDQTGEVFNRETEGIHTKDGEVYVRFADQAAAKEYVVVYGQLTGGSPSMHMQSGDYAARLLAPSDHYEYSVDSQSF